MAGHEAARDTHEVDLFRSISRGISSPIAQWPQTQQTENWDDDSTLLLLHRLIG